MGLDNMLSENKNAIHLLEKNLDKINWRFLSKNENAIHLLEKNLDKINWCYLSLNESESAIHLIEQNLDKVDWKSLSKKFDNLITNPDDIEDLNRRGAYLHVLADALVSVLVILALLIGMRFPNLVILDPIIGIVAGVVIARWSFGLMVESRNQLLELDG